MIAIGFVLVITLLLITCWQLSEIIAHLNGLKIFLNKRMQRLSDDG